VKIEDTVITQHAIGRFKQRYEALKGVQLNDAELEARLRDLVSRAVPEEENPVLDTRRQAHGGIGMYLINPPWRFVFSEKRLETCEIVPQEMLFVKNPHIPAHLEKARFFIKIKIDRRRLLTKITRSFDKKTLHLQNLIEINAIIRALRILGMEVNRLAEPHRLEVVIPQKLDVYWIEQFVRPENLLIALGRTDSFPLGRQRINCSGILKLDLDRILNFLQVNKVQ